MRKSTSFLVFLALVFAAFVPLCGTLVAQQPMIAKIVEFAAPSQPVANPAGTFSITIGFPTSAVPPCNPCAWPPPPPLVSVAPAFSPVPLGCGSLMTAGQLAQVLANGINGNTAGYTASVSGNRVLVVGPPIQGQSDFWVVVSHAEISQSYGYALETGKPIVNLCDGILGNEWGYIQNGGNASSGQGIDVKLTTLVDDPQAIGNFESTSGFTIPPNWSWDGVGTVLTLNLPANGFPTSGGSFLSLSTQGITQNIYGSLKLSTAFPYTPSTPVLRFDYHYANGGIPGSPLYDFFEVRMNADYWYVQVAREDYYSPLSTGVRTIEVDLREVFPYLTSTSIVQIEVSLDRGCCSQGAMPNTVVLLDNFRFTTPQLGEGNGIYPNPSFRIQTATWDFVRGLSQMSGADKRMSPFGGAIVVQTWLNQWSGQPGFPFLIMGSFSPYGSQPLAGLVGEPNIIGIDFGTSVLMWTGNWGPSYPAIPFFLPPGVSVDGFYVQAALFDGIIRVSNRIRHLLQ